jgi:isopenicillin-N epimerase
VKELFLLDPEVVFLNHGSFGACPRPVFEAYQRYQLELERQPVEFLGRRFPELVDAARARLAAYLPADPDGLVFVPNATAGVNVVARSLPLRPGDEVLATDREYVAVDMVWRFVCERAGARYVRTTPAQLWDAVTARTRVIAVSHMSSWTAEILPVEEICRRAREAGILTLVDGAHAPGQLPLDLDALGADAYTGNCHKWLCAPKGAGFLLAAPGIRDLLEPLIVSWDWERETAFAARNRWQGTLDPAAWLAVPDAIDFQDEHDWDAVRSRCHGLAARAQSAVAELAGIEPPAGPFAQMSSAQLPPCDAAEVQRRLLEEHRIEVICREWEGRPLIRVSFQGYNDEQDLDRLLEALPRALQLDALQAE